MNTMQNDKGETVLAVGAPYSIIRLKHERPRLIGELKTLREKGAGKLSHEWFRQHLGNRGFAGLELAAMVAIVCDGVEH